MPRVGLVNKDLEQLGIRLAVLDGENVGIKGGDGVEEVLELGVAEVGVDLCAVLDAGGGKLEAVDSPAEVLLTLRAGTERKTLTESRLVNLDDVDAGSLEVDNLVAEGESELLSLDGLMDVVTREGPAQAGDRASKHTLHRLLADAGGVLALLHGHGSRAGDVADNNGRPDAARTVRLHPSMGSENIAVKALAKVLHHVVTLRLAVDIDVQLELILDCDDIADLLLNELLVLFSGDLALGELVALDADILGLREAADGRGREERQLEVLDLLLIPRFEGALALVHLLGDGFLPLLHIRVVRPLAGSAALQALCVRL